MIIVLLVLRQQNLEQEQGHHITHYLRAPLVLMGGLANFY
jgi:hypothetical protein